MRGRAPHPFFGFTTGHFLISLGDLQIDSEIYFTTTWFNVNWIIMFYKYITAMRLFRTFVLFSPDRGVIFIVISA